MVALTGTIQGNAIVVDDDFVIPSDRANHVDEYMKEMRENDK